MAYLNACVPLAGLVALLTLTIRTLRTPSAPGGRVAPSSVLWALPAAAALAFLACWGALGLIAGGWTLPFLVVASAGIAASGVVCVRRQEVWAAYDGTPPERQTLMRRALLVAIPVLAMLTIEVPFNEKLLFLGGPSHFWLEMVLVGLLMLALWFLSCRHAGLCVLGVAFCLVCGIGQYFVRAFKNAAILPSDLLVLETAAAVTGEYVFTLTAPALLGIMFACLTVCALALVRPEPTRSGRGVLRDACCGVVCALALAALVFLPIYRALGLDIMYWYSIDYYQQQGFLPSFILVWHDMPIPKPEGYTAEAATSVLDEHARAFRETQDEDAGRQAAQAQFAERPPSIICVMNESFADLSVFDGMHALYEGPTYFNSIPDALARGTLDVAVFGAGTCNTEFEFLTNTSITFLGAGKYPYSIFDLTGTDALPAQLKELGYDTSAIHPNYPSNWKRNRVYPLLGFGTFYAADDFGGVPDTAVDAVCPNPPHAEVFHSGVSDKATYELALDLVREHEAPQFVFDVTMANHGSYDQGNIPEAYRLDYQPEGFEGEETPERLNEYLSCIKRSDDDLAWLVAELERLDEPVVLVFFGDHQPKLTLEYNDWWYPGEDEGVHARRIYHTSYLIWANFDVAGREQVSGEDETSADMLGATTLELIGAPLSTYQEALLDIRTSIRALSIGGYLGNDDTWYASQEDSPYEDTYRDLSLIEYLNFAARL